MKNYLEVMKDIMDNGISMPDRTWTGRKKVFGRQLRFDISKHQLPLVTTRYIGFKTMVRETRWFVRGSSSNDELLAENVKIWNLWAVKDEDIEKFVNKHAAAATPEEKIMIAKGIAMASKGNIGRLYGEAWRNAPSSYFNGAYPKVDEADVAPDKLAEYKEGFENDQPKHEDGTAVTWEEYLFSVYYSSVDQLQQLMVNLKKRPFSSRLIINAWIPEFVPFEELSPQENVILGKGSLAACHVLQQYLVFPPKEKGGKLRLSMQLYIR